MKAQLFKLSGSGEFFSINVLLQLVFAQCVRFLFTLLQPPVVLCTPSA